MAKLRRVPTQERSRKRLEAILAAAAEVFAEVGFDAATMESIAERAETSVGSLYQFFPNKLAVFRALAERTIERSYGLFAELLGDVPASRDWRELVDTVVDGFAGLQEREPGIRALFRNFQLYGEFEEADRALERQMVAVTAGILEARAPDMPAARRETVATVVVEVIGVMMLVATRAGRKGMRPLLEETKLVVRRYLEPEITG